MEEENVVNDYIDSILDKYSNLGKNPCVSILKINRNTNNTNNTNDIYVMIMYSATVLKECSLLKKHIKKCNCCNIIYISMILDNDLNLINVNNNSVYINDLYDIVINVIKKLKN
jgi:hypothetical protein